MLLSLLPAISTRAGTITVVNLPPTSTDLATGINTNKTYVSCFDFGSANATVYSVNGVPFVHVRSAANNVYLITNWVDTNVLHGGQIIVTTGVTNKGIDVTSSSSQGGLANQSDGNMFSILTDVMYPGNGAPIGGWIQAEFDNLTIGHPYSLRIYYRFWGNANGDRTQNFWFNGEGTWQPYSANPLDEDAGTNGVLPNGAICHGARYLEYDFTASATNVFCLASNLVANGAAMFAGATLEDTSYPYPPAITYQAQALTAAIPSVFFVNAIGTTNSAYPTLSYQWYSNSVNSYSGAAAVGNGNDYSGATANTLNATNNILDYYFAVVANSYGTATSSIVQINPNPVIVSQPVFSPTVGVSVQYTVAANGVPPLAYQWYSNTVNSYTGASATANGSNYSGSTNASLTATNFLADYYFVIVTNSYGSITSAITAYNPLPSILAQPKAFKSGVSVALGVTATNAWPSLGYQWYFNSVSNYSGTISTDGNGVSGSQTATVIITNVSDYYYVVVTNAYGSVTSSIALATIPLTVQSAGEPIWNTNNNVIVTFSDILDPTTATSGTNYVLDNGATVLSARLGGSNEVVLTTSALTSNPYTVTVQHVKDYYGITLATSPTNLAVGVYPANLALWARANTGVTADSSGNVSQWNDMSANQNNLETISPIDPLLATNALGDPVIRFNATNDTEMDAFPNPNGSLSITGDMSIVAVINFAALGGATAEIVSKTGSGGQANIPAPFDWYAANAPELLRGNGGSGGQGTSYGSFSATTTPAVGVPQILAVSETGNTVTHYINGNQVGSGLLSANYQEANDADAGNDLEIGVRADGVNRFTGDFSELILAGSPLSSYDVAQLTPYLAQVHNIVLVNTNPTNIVSSVAGGNLTLSWPSDHTGWQLQAQTNILSVGLSTNWVNVSGTTGTNLVVIPLNLTNGSVFYRLVY